MLKKFQWNGEALPTLLITVVVLALFALLFWLLPVSQSTRSRVLTVSALEGAIRTGQLSDFSTVYSGVTQLTGPAFPEELHGSVSYEAKVDACLDPSLVSIHIDPEDNTVYMILPTLQITCVQVDASSVDVTSPGGDIPSSAVLHACQADADAASRQEHAAYAQAEQTAQSLLTALVTPVLQQLDQGYRLEVV